MTSAAEPLNLSNLKDISSLRNDFPALHQNVNGKPLVYLDSAASAQRPQSVIDAMVHKMSKIILMCIGGFISLVNDLRKLMKAPEKKFELSLMLSTMKK